MNRREFVQSVVATATVCAPPLVGAMDVAQGGDGLRKGYERVKKIERTKKWLLDNGYYGSMDGSLHRNGVVSGELAEHWKKTSRLAQVSEPWLPESSIQQAMVKLSRMTGWTK